MEGGASEWHSMCGCTCGHILNASLAVPDSHGRGESPPVRVWHCETACKRSFFQFAPEKKIGRPVFWSGHDPTDPTGSARPVVSTRHLTVRSGYVAALLFVPFR